MSDANRELSIPLKEHLELLAEAEKRFAEERDRRYSEVALEREKALKIKETADLAALQLAREIQTYKDEKANELREQINAERHLYASKADVDNAIREVNAVIKPIVEYVSGQRGVKEGIGLTTGALVTIVTVVVSIIIAVGIVVGLSS